MPTALITGATAGIGHTFAQQLAARGDDLVLVARDRDRLERVAAELTAVYAVAVEVLPADLTDRAQLARVEERIVEPERPVELLVNNAGFGLKHRFLTNSVEDEQAMLDVLVVAVLRLSHAALGAMTTRHADGDPGGGIINVSSVAAFLPRGTYSAAKAWVNSFSEWAHYEYADRGVTVTSLCPGFTKTEFHARMDVRRSSAPAWMWLDADRLVADALADHARGKVYSVPSRRYQVLARLARLVPNSVLQRAQSLGRR